MDWRLDSFEIMIREIQVIFVGIDKRIFNMNEGGESDGDIELGIGTDDEEVGYEALVEALGQEGVLSLMDEGGVERLFE